MAVLGWVSMGVKRQHDRGHPYEAQHLIGAGIQDQRFSSLPACQETWWPPGRQSPDQVIIREAGGMGMGVKQHPLFSAW